MPRKVSLPAYPSAFTFSFKLNYFQSRSIPLNSSNFFETFLSRKCWKLFCPSALLIIPPLRHEQNRTESWNVAFPANFLTFYATKVCFLTDIYLYGKFEGGKALAIHSKARNNQDKKMVIDWRIMVNLLSNLNFLHSKGYALLRCYFPYEARRKNCFFLTLPFLLIQLL